ncbi:cytochrome P450, variant [Capsaspora owczarzaki ATCC 30864]|uniref:Cytochrome P450, variant n=1 Tax=Capsaspora owczarzaki (strain ATCC 30864) TaxID=595528 RepID=A0A0D2UC12_CAPO3|nr:cytochrome P450, variant [Capsaspora owczarzaki ATCC 30864]
MIIVASQAVLRGSHHIEKSFIYWFLTPWLGRGLLTSGGDKWRTRRRMLTPAFHFDILRGMVEVFREQAEVLIGVLDASADTKKPIDVFPLVSLCALDSICETAMGKKLHALKQSESTYVQAVFRISELIHHRQKFPWNWPDFIYSWLPDGRDHTRVLAELHNFTDSVIAERRVFLNDNPDVTDEQADSSKKRRLAFLDLLISARDEDGNHLSNMDIREEVDTFMFEGHDTTAAALAWSLHLIGSHPDVQARIHEELDRVLGSEPSPSFEQLKAHELPYLEMTLKEALRLFPSVPAISRVLDQDIDVCGYKIPAGLTVGLIPYAVHRDPKHWPDPEAFNPDRFLPENSANRHPYAYIPFSAGPRNCIGQRFAEFEERVVMASILKRFRIVSTQTRDQLAPLGEIILRPRDGVWVTLERR